MAAAAKSTYAIELQDDTSGAANRAAKALETLKSRIDGDAKALRAMQAAQRNLKGATVVNAAAVKELGDRIAAQKAKVAQAQSAYIRLGGTFEKVKPKSDQAAGGIEGLLVQLKGLRGTIAASGPIVGGLVAIAAALGALVVGLAAATAALLKYGVASANARRSELLQLEGLTKLRNMYGVAAGSATELQAAIDRVSRSVPQNRSEINGMATGLYRAGLRGAALRESLEALAIVEAAQGAAGVARMRGRIIADARAGRSAQRLGDVQARLGSIARRRMLSLDVQQRKLNESFAALFDDLKIEGFLGALNEITQLFSQNTATGRALKSILTALFNPVIDALSTLGPIAKRFFQGLVIGALLFTIALLRVRNFLRDTFGGSEMFENLDALKIALVAGVVVFTVAAAALTVLGLAAASLVAPFVAVGVAVQWFTDRIVGAINWMRAQDWGALGRAIVDGLVSGIRNGVARVTGAIRGLAGQARSALASALQIQSPSKVFAQLGVQIPAGLGQGIERGTPRVAGAVEGMVSIPSEAEATGGAAAPAARSSMSISVGDIHVHTAATDAQGIVQDVRDEFLRMLEGLAIERGAPA